MEKGVKTLYLCGYSTFGTILSTQMDAVGHDFDVKIIVDCILEPLRKYEGIELAHRMFPRSCDMATAQDVLSMLHAASPA